MILNNNFGEESEYEICIVFYKYDEILIKLLIFVRKIKINNNICYLIYINLMSIFFNIFEMDKLEIFMKGRIRKNNLMISFYIGGDIVKKIFLKINRNFI